VDRDREERDASRDESEIAVSADEMFEHVYTELRGLAAAKLSRERRGHTLSPDISPREDAFVGLME
jgi:hypothetical protein